MNDNKIKISELTAATNIGDNDVVAGVVNENTAKIPFGLIKNAVKERKEEATFAISDAWDTLIDSDPFAYSHVMDSPLTDKANDIELVNDDPVSFARYGYQIGAYNTTSGAVTFYATALPPTDVTLKVIFSNFIEE